MVNAPLTDWIAEQAIELGFAMCGVVHAEKFPELARNEEWLERGYAGEMHYLSDTRRDDLQRVMPGVRTVIVCAMTYNTQLPRTAQACAGLNSAALEEDGPRGWISRYGWGDDYHEVLRGKLEALIRKLRDNCSEPFEARVYTDTGPINERVLAKHAGLGWLGKNTLLLNEQTGSYFFLGTILTTLDLQPTLGNPLSPPADRCGSCRRCIDACPTDALVEPYVMDARRCISYLTIELRGPIPEELREPMGPHVFGCDICQDVCPWNRNAPVTLAQEFQPRTYARDYSETGGMGPLGHDSILEDINFVPAAYGVGDREALFLPRLEWLASLKENDFRQMFRDSAIKRTKWKGLVRNACLALGNAKVTSSSATKERVLRLLSRLALSDDPTISESAQWAISRIQKNSVNTSADSKGDASERRHALVEIGRPVTEKVDSYDIAED
jgi:epoxyqueuosine reductase